MRRLAWIPILAAAAWGDEPMPAEDAPLAAAGDSVPAALGAPAIAWSPDSLPSRSVGAFTPSGPGAAPSVAETPGASSPGRVFFDLRAATPFNDFQMGGRVGFFAGRRTLLDFFLDFEMRPYRRAVRVRESETLEYQLREERFTFGPGMLARLPLGGSGAALVAGGGAGLSPAWYRGSNRSAPSTGVGWLETGIRFWSAPSGSDWGFSYQYFPLPDVSPHRISFQYGYRLDSK
jgi:hypothetical protein